MNKVQLFFHRSAILFYSVAGEILKCRVRHKCFRLPEYGTNRRYVGDTKIIVSLTSYGRRVEDVLPYTIYSLLKQTYKPDMVILWLDSENWNDDNIPESLKKLKEYGLTINYCEDLKSYKKHIPALEMYPNASVITTDDDFYYSKYMIEKLVNVSRNNRNYICTLRAHRPTFGGNGNLLPYNSWDMMQHDTSKGPLFPTTGGGCLFRLELLHSDTLDKSLFFKLCPKADDVWFYIMGVLKKTPVKVLPSWPFMMIPLDFFYQKSHRGSSLQDVNRGESLNDAQIRSVMEYYNLKAKDLCF